MYSLGNKTKAKEVFCETLHYTTLDPPAGGGATPNLQDVLNTGNEAISDMYLDEKYSLGTAADPTAEFRKRVNGIGTDVVIRGKNAATGVIDDALIVKADGTLEARSAVIRSDNATADEVRIGNFTSATPVGNESVNIGEDCGGNGGLRGVNIGWQTGINGGTRSVCIGDEAGQNGVGNRAVAIGQKAMESGGSNDAICIGAESGRVLAGEDAIAIGHYAGETQLDDNTLVLNASGSALNTGGANRCYIRPVRQNQINTDDEVCYLDNDGGTFELTHGRLKPGIFEITAAAGGSYNASAFSKTITICRWTPGSPGLFVYNLPNASFIVGGQRFIIKNFSQDPTQTVEVRPATGQLIDGSNTPLQLTASARSTAGGGGSCVELVEYNNQWYVVASYNQSV